MPGAAGPGELPGEMTQVQVDKQGRMEEGCACPHLEVKKIALNACNVKKCQILNTSDVTVHLKCTRGTPLSRFLNTPLSTNIIPQC